MQHDLQELILPSTSEEMDEGAKDLPTDKASGPDGLNEFFFKKS